MADQFKIISLKKISWQRLASRPGSLIFASVCAFALRDLKRLTGIPGTLRHRLAMSDGHLFHDRQDLAAWRGFFIRGGHAAARSYLARLGVRVRNYEQCASGLAGRDWARTGRRELAAAFAEWLAAAAAAHAFLTTLPVAIEALTDRLAGRLKGNRAAKERTLGALLTPAGQSVFTGEAEGFYRLAKMYLAKRKRYRPLFEEHARRYSWLGTRGYFWDQAWQKKDFEIRLLNFVVSGQSPDKKLGEIEAGRKAAAASRRLALDEIKGYGRGIRQEARTLMAFADRKFWRTDSIYRSGYLSRGLFRAIAARTGFPLAAMPYLTVDESQTLLDSGRAPVTGAELTARRRFFVHVIWNERELVLAGKARRQRIMAALKKSPRFLSPKELKGLPACPGTATGRVRLISEARDFRRLQEGEILVMDAIYPQLSSGLEKAAAFITDEGGMLSHAAVLAREMNKPCVIGTRYATKILSTGDRVAINADRGVVKLIS